MRQNFPGRTRSHGALLPLKYCFFFQFYQISVIQYYDVQKFMHELSDNVFHLRRMRYIGWFQVAELINFCLWPPWSVTVNKYGWIIECIEHMKEYYEHDIHGFLPFMRDQLPNTTSAAINNYVRISWIVSYLLSFTFYYNHCFH